MERIHVAVRSRPLSPEDAASTPWRISGNSIALASQPSTRFEFDRIFDEDCRTSDVYEARTKHIVDSVVRGFNGTVFAYGQTSSGKTYTMRGCDSEPGIIPLAVHGLFQHIQENVDREFLLRMSYMEIYNEEINDLLVPEHRKLQIHESLDRGIYVAGLREEIVTCPEQVMGLMSFGESHRHIGETNMNLYSSRSHTIFRMVIESRERVEENEPGECDAVRVSVLNLVDLAGSERAAKTGAEGVRLKEGSHINKSLMTLGTVIKKLSEGVDGQGGHVPYRDSKLTRILQPSLGGNANTAIICNITLAQVHADETKSSLQFASRALRVTNCACVNEIMTDAALLKRQKKEIEELRAKLRASQNDHWEEEILNLRNTLLQSELEKERIALELEEEKKAKEQRDRRLTEQAKKIENLSSLVLNSDRFNKNTAFTKKTRRVTWCPGPYTEHSDEEDLAEVQDGPRRSMVRQERNMEMPPSFEVLIQGRHANNSEPCADACSSGDLSKGIEDASLLDSHALMLVTSRRRTNKMRKQDQEKLRLSIDEAMVSKDLGDGNGGVLSQESSESSASNGLSDREAEAIIVIKQLQDQIKLLELEKSSIQSNMDEVLELATQQNASFSEKYEELRQNALAAQQQEFEHDFIRSVLMEANGINLEFTKSRWSVDQALSLVDELKQNLSLMAQDILEVQHFAYEDLTQLNSITKDYEKVSTCLMDKVCKLETEKKHLNEQLQDQESEIDRLKSSLESCEKTVDECTLLHEMEKDKIFFEFLKLQKEVKTLSSSALMKEKESIRKELEKTKTKLSETENKLKSSIQEKIKLQSEKAEALKEIKNLESQRTFLERDLKKRDTLSVDKRHEMNSELARFSNQAVYMEEEYQKLEMYAADMKAEIYSLQEALNTSIAEKDEALSKLEVMSLELEEYANKLNSAESERDSLNEKIAVLTENACVSESTIRKLEATLDSISRQKEEMGMQLTDVLEEMESERSMWTAKEKEYTQADLKLSNCRDELAKVREELVNCKKQCRTLEGRLNLPMESDMNEKTIKCCEAGKGSDHLLGKGGTIYDPIIPLHENELHKELLAVMEERNNLLSEAKKMRLIIDEAEVLKENYNRKLGYAESTVNELSSRISDMEVEMKKADTIFTKEKTKYRMRIIKLEAELDAHRDLLKEAVTDNRTMDAKYEEACNMLKKKLYEYGQEILKLREQLNQSQGTSK